MTTPEHGYWCGTNSGKIIDLLNPDFRQITIEDIACGLSKMCRFNGQLKEIYSVAEHSMNVASLVPEEHKLAALLHDATEAYICDVPTPLKRLLGEAYTAIENRLAAAISVAFSVDLVNLPDCVKQADRIMVVTERDHLQHVPLKWSADYENSLRYPRFRVQWGSSVSCREAFIKQYKQFIGGN